MRSLVEREFLRSAPSMTVLFVIPAGDLLPSGTVRVRQFLPFLDRRGVKHTVLSYYSPFLDRCLISLRAGRGPRALRPVLLTGASLLQLTYKWSTRARVLLLAPLADAVFFQGVLPPVWFVRALLRLNPRVVLDMDDAIFLGNPRRGAAVVPLMWQVIAGSHSIFDYARALNPSVALVPSAVSLERYVHDGGSVGNAARPGIRIGWLGSASTVRYLDQLVEPLRLLANEGHAIELLLAGVANGGAATPQFPGIAVTYTPSYRDQDIPALVAGYDIGVMPLDDGPWERAKCAMKAIIYMAARKPTLCSRVGENSHLIDDGVNGFLASSEAEWTAKLRTLISDPERAAEMGRRGRATIEARYSTDVCFALLEKHVFSRVGATGLAAGVSN